MATDPSALRGAITPLVTPFNDGVVDLDGYAASIERQVDGGSDGIVVTGTTGEPASLSVAERIALIETAVEAAAGRIRVVAATGSSSLAETLAMTEAATAAGANALMIVAPAFTKPSQRGLVEYFTTVAAVSPLPLLLYNIPGRAAVNIEVDTVAAVAKRCPTLVGVKSALADLDYVTALIDRLGPEFRVFCGVESLSYPMLALGGAGLMSAVGNLLPRKVADLCRAVTANDHPRARSLHNDLFALNRAIFFDTNPVPLKAMMALAGFGNGEVRLPLAPADAALVDRLRSIIGAHIAHLKEGTA